jgi:hypothetical protein
MRILHLGLCVQPKPYNGFQQAFIDVVGADNYFELSTGGDKFNENAKLLFDLHHPELVFMQIQSPNIIKKETVKYFYDQGAKVINWTGDVRTTTPQWMVDIAQWCTTSFSNMVDVRFMQSKGFKSEYLEIGYDPKIYTPEGSTIDCPEIVLWETLIINFRYPIFVVAWFHTCKRTLEIDLGYMVMAG